LSNGMIAVKNILFLCTGNICRSAFAERFFNKLVRQTGLIGIASDSAGLLALPGNAATAMAQKVAYEHGVDLFSHRANPVSKRLVAWSDLVLVMEKSHERDLLDAFPEAEGKILLLRYFARYGSRRRDIADPYGLQHEAYRFCFLDIEEAVSGLVAYLAGTTRVFEPVKVACYEGYRANEAPRSFERAGHCHCVADIIDRWYAGLQDETGGIADYFKVRTDDGGIHILRYDRDEDAWAAMTP
jgi:protein-tyrosine phosphatase